MSALRRCPSTALRFRGQVEMLRLLCSESPLLCFVAVTKSPTVEEIHFDGSDLVRCCVWNGQDVSKGAVDALIAAGSWQLHELQTPHVIGCLEALMHLGHPEHLTQALLQEMPSAWHLSTEELLRWLRVQKMVAQRFGSERPPDETQPSGAPGVMALLGQALAEARAVLRSRLRGELTGVWGPGAQAEALG
ncbi:unnamed protein product [Effrenium voratum]|nr:unnamed protein product [Effrenium voratum]